MTTSQNILRFLFQNANGKFYEIFLKVDGSGYALLVGASANPSGSSMTGGTQIALTIDADKVAFLSGADPRNVSYWCHVAGFNTAQRLATILNA